MISPPAHIQLFALTLWASLSPAAASEQQLLQKTLTPDNIDADVIVDTRPLTSCQQATLGGAVCLPVEDIIAPQRRLANWSGILWLLGTAGLNGSEHVMVIGESAERRDFLAGVLFLAGQHQISIVDGPISSFISNLENTSTGIQRSTTRLEVFTTPMRSELIVLSNELQQLTTGDTVILDGRTESEYFGATIRAQRGGHIPGAIHSPVTEWRSAAQASFAADISPVIYSHDSYSGLQYFSTLLAAGLQVRLYIGGWVEWAADSSLSADNVSYANHHTLNSATKTSSVTGTNAPEQSQRYIHPDNGVLLLLIAIASILLGTGFLAGRRVSGKVN